MTDAHPRERPPLVLIHGDTYERWLRGIEGYWQYIGSFGFAGGLPTEDEHPIEPCATSTPNCS